MFASEWNTLSKPNNRVVGPSGVLMGGQDGSGNLPSPSAIANLAAWYDVSDFSRMTIDGSNRVQLIGDKSAYSVDNCLVLPAVSGNYASTPDAAALHVTGDIGIMVHGSMVNYNTGTYQTLVSRLDGSINRSYWLDINNGGALSLNTTSDGTTGTLATGNSTVVTSIPNLSEKWIFATLDVDNGAAGHDYKFYLSDDGVTWTQLGTTVTTAGVISIFAGTSPLEIGSVLLGTAQLTAGNFKRVKIYNGYDFAGSVVFDEDFSLEAKLATSVTATTGQTVTINATAIALPARIHGARDLYMGTQASQPYYAAWSGTNYGYLNGVTGNGFSTPDSAALGITGDIDLRVKVAMDDWTPASNSMLISKRTSDDEWTFYLQTDGKLNINWWNSVAANSEVISTAATGFTDRTTHWVRVTLDVDNGAGGYTVNFYGSDDGITWTAVGDPIVTGAGTTDVKNSTSDIIVGAQTTFASVAAGAFYQAQIYNGIAGTLAADFNASDYATGSTFVSSATGETWTINGGATIVDRTQIIFDGTNDYLKSAAFSLSQPENVYFVGQQVTWTSNDHIYSGGTAGAMEFQQVNGGASPNVELYGGSAVATNTGFVLKTNAVLTTYFNGASSGIRVNRGTATTGNPGSQAGNGFTLGAYPTGAVLANITVSEILIYDTVAHTTAQQDRLALYLGRKQRIAV
jgi:hypothetical protein